MHKFAAVLRLSLFALLLSLLVACAGAGKPEAVVPPEQRAQQRWDALLAGDFTKAFSYLSPGMRSESTAEAYAAQMGARPIRWKSAEVLSADCEAEGAPGLCRVTVRVEFTAPASTPGVRRMGASTALTERWILVDGQWHFVSRSVAAGR